MIYDVGAENGDDSAYYLHRGFKVIGIEANPDAVERLRARFSAEIGEGRYVLLPVGIAERPGKARFWICDDHPPWSSFDREIASRQGSRHHCVDIETRPFRAILEEFGRAAYCKIDIEGNDDQCIRSFTARTLPSYVSVELIRGEEQLGLLRAQGYEQFKIVSQRTFRQPAQFSQVAQSHLPAFVRRPLKAAEARLMRHQPDHEWHFRGGSSGPFGEETEGPWRSFEEALRMCELIGRVGGKPYDWHDIHARLAPAG